MSQIVQADEREVTFRPARPEDVEETYEVAVEATDDLNHRYHRPGSLRDGSPARALGFRRSSLRSDPERFWVAQVAGTIVGFGLAVIRGRVWYLATLQVRPAFQGRKIGTELLKRCLAGAAPDTVRTVVTDAITPVSNGLYLTFGMLPQEPVMVFDGAPLDAVSRTASKRGSRARTSRGSLRLGRRIDPAGDRAALAMLDAATVGFARTVDHEFWGAVSGLHGRLLFRSGRLSGCLYVSDRGVVGPIALFHAEDLPEALDLAWQRARDDGAASLHVRLPTTARSGISWAVEHGLRLTGIGMLLTSEPIGRYDGCVLSGGDSLY